MEPQSIEYPLAFVQFKGSYFHVSWEHWSLRIETLTRELIHRNPFGVPQTIMMSKEKYFYLSYSYGDHKFNLIPEVEDLELIRVGVLSRHVWGLIIPDSLQVEKVYQSITLNLSEDWVKPSPVDSKLLSYLVKASNEGVYL